MLINFRVFVYRQSYTHMLLHSVIFMDMSMVQVEKTFNVLHTYLQRITYFLQVLPAPEQLRGRSRFLKNRQRQNCKNRVQTDPLAICEKSR